MRSTKQHRRWWPALTGALLAGSSLVQNVLAAPPDEQDTTTNPSVEKSPDSTSKADKPQAWVYRWKDVEGNWVISDKPPAHGQAEAIMLPKPQIYSPPPTKGLSEVLEDDMVDKRPKADVVKVPTPRILSPANDSWLDNNVGNAVIQVALSGPIPEGYELRVYLDGKLLGKGQTQFKLSNLPRGSHRVRADVVQLKKRKVATSTQSVFYVRRPFIKH